MKGDMVFRFGLFWGAAVCVTAGVLLYLGIAPGGAHWAFLGTPLDDFMHRERFWLVPMLAAPLIVITVLLLAWRRDVQFTVMLCLFSVTAALLWWLVFVALE